MDRLIAATAAAAEDRRASGPGRGRRSAASREARTSDRPFLVLAILAASLSTPLFAQPPAEDEVPVRDEGSVEEQITVSETGLLLDFRGLLSARQVRSLSADEIRVFEDDAPRSVVRLEPILRSADDTWHLLIYVDAVLSSAETIRQTALTLAQHIPAMARLGEIRLLVNDGTVRELVPPTRSITRLEDALAELGKRPVAFDRLAGMRQRFDTELVRAGAEDVAMRLRAVEQEVELVRRQGDALLRTVGGGCPADACSLLLVSDGFDLRPELYYLGAELAAEHPESGLGAQRTAVGLAESLSALEWVTLALPMREAEPAPDAEDKPRGSPDSDYVRFKQQAGSHFDGITINRKRRRSSLDRLSLDDLGAYLRPTLQPLRMLAEETSGGLVSTPELLSPELEGLAERFRVWYRTSRALDGRIRPVEAYLVAGNRPIRSPFWTDASTPEGVAAARARGILEATAGHGTLPVRVELQDGAPVATVDWGAESPSLASGLQLPVRITIATAAAGAGQPSIRHRVTEIVTSADTTTTTHPIETPLPEDVEMAVVIEDLRLRVWGAARLRLP